MRKLYTFLAAILMAQTFSFAQFNVKDIEYWTGNGSDTTVLVVDFLDGTMDSSYAWGFLFNDSTTGQEILENITAADTNFSVTTAGGFLNDVYYHSHSGVGGSPDYWSTWSMADTGWYANTGLIETVTNGEWYGISYTDFAPAIEPGTPIPAFPPYAFTFDDIDHWIGSGSNSAMLVIDFLNGNDTSSYAWGYKFDGIATAEKMLNDIAADDSLFIVDISGGFLMNVIYQSDSGIGGSPNYWGAWSATNLGNWYMNAGITDTLEDGELWGASYTDFNPAVRPGIPVSAQATQSDTTILSINPAEPATEVTLYPVPATDQLNLIFNYIIPETIIIYDITGRKVWQSTNFERERNIDISHLDKGVYFIKMDDKTLKWIKD